MRIKLLSLTIERFKGIDNLELEFNGHSASIYASNGLGKTTICDAWLWLLTGKDSTGSADFAIKPVDGDGEIIDHAAHSIVMATIDADGQKIYLAREYYEKWSKKRGNIEATYDGNTTDFYINGVPKSKTDYEKALETLIPMDEMRLISNTAAFAALPWKKRLEILFELAGIGSDLEMMAEVPKYAPLLEAAAPIGLNDLRAQLKARRKKVNGRLNDLPLLIQNNRETERALSGVPFDTLRASLADLEEDDRRLTEELAAAMQGDTGALTNAVQEAQLAIRQLEQENAAYRLEQERKRPVDERPALEREQASFEAEIARTEQAYKADSALYHSQMEQVKKYSAAADKFRAQWLSISKDAFTGATCAYCGQPLQGEHLTHAKDKWQQEHDRALTSAQNSGVDAVNAQRSAEQQAEAARQRMADDESRIAELRDRLNDLKTRIAALPAVSVPEIVDMPDYAQKHKKLAERLTQADEALTLARQDRAAHSRELQEKRHAVRDEMDSLREQLGNENALKVIHQKIAELEGERTRLAGELAGLDRLTDLAEDFVRYKASYITTAINSKFRIAQFQLTSDQVNGGLTDTCDIMCGGVPYDKGLNNGAKVNVGLDIINTLSSWYGCYVPVFVDNAESVVELEPIDTQVIRLVVSAEDKEKVRMELE